MAIISAYMGPDHVEFIHFDTKSEAERLADPPYQKNLRNLNKFGGVIAINPRYGRPGRGGLVHLGHTFGTLWGHCGTTSGSLGA